jgi:Domain of unknown function (DUF4268)
MIDETLGKLEKVDLRYIWQSESTDFTPWLGRPDNLAVLAETIGMDLELEAQEKDVGPFRADILCKDSDTESWVLIENQLDRTDHLHLGQLLTYAAGLQAVTIVWIAGKFTEEHRATLDWLNDVTDGRLRFFGLEVELWRIGESPPAPRFNIISKPNDWSQSVGRAARQLNEEPLSETKAQQRRYWQAFNDYLDAHRTGIRTKTPRPRNWARFAIGRAGFNLSGKVNAMENRIRAELRLRGKNARAYFALLQEQKEDIERIVGEALSWEELRVGARIALYKGGVDPTAEGDWPNQHAWLADALVRLDRALGPGVRTLHIDEARDNAAS